MEKTLYDNGIRAIVTFRAKRLDRLKTKLEKRHVERNYQCVADIYTDLADLAGVRIALYFPGDIDEVDKLIRSDFDVHEERLFPDPAKQSAKQSESTGYKKRFSGYWAHHYRLRLKHIAPGQERFGQANVEVQVASVLMHAWAEVEHDLVYKPLSGQLSREEFSILDEINGLVLAGEIALENLQKAGKNRISSKGQPFNNHYELASYLYSTLASAMKSHRQTRTDHASEISLGRVDVLFRFLQLIGKASPDALKGIVNSMRIDGFVTFRIADRILPQDPGYYLKYLRARQDAEGADPLGNDPETHDAALNFVMSWATLEQVLIALGPSGKVPFRHLNPQVYEKYGLSSRELLNAQNLVTSLMHGLRRFPVGHLAEMTGVVTNALEHLKTIEDAEVRKAINLASAAAHNLRDIVGPQPSDT